MSIKTIRNLLFILVILTALAIFQTQKTQTISAPSKQVLGVQIGIRTKTSDCHPNNSLPDTACTPGLAIFGVTVEEICTSGYSKKVRNVPDKVKKEVYLEYGIATHTTGEYEVDHLISLELGGSNDIANLWPEAANPAPGCHEKDRVENYLHQRVCDGLISLSDAQRIISSDWTQILKELQ
jgi:hypothetical protein